MALDTAPTTAWWKSKTNLVAIATLIAGAVQTFAPFLTPTQAGYAATGLGILNFFIRTFATSSPITGTPMGDKAEAIAEERNFGG